MELIPARVKAARELAGLSQKQVAGRAGVSIDTVRRAENGAHQIGANAIGAIAAVLEVSLDSLYDHGPVSTTSGNGHGRDATTDLEPTPSTELARTAGMGSK